MKANFLFLLSALLLLSITMVPAQSDAEFVKKAASGGMMEVALGKIAQTKAISNDVKQFGTRMVEDHTKANNQLKQIAQSKHLEVPAQLMDKHQKEVDKFSAMSPDKFDKAYMKLMVKDHKEDIKEFEDAAKDVKDSELKAWANQTLPILREHHEMAQRIEDNVD